jgi:hypothetical protein
MPISEAFPPRPIYQQKPMDVLILNYQSKPEKAQVPRPTLPFLSKIKMLVLAVH